MKKSIKILPLVLAFSLAFAACGAPAAQQPANSEATPQQTEGADAQNNETAETEEIAVGGEIVIGLTGDPYNLAPWVSNDMNASLVMNSVLPSLLKFEEDGNKHPYIVKGYTISDDATEYVVEIHEGLKWHDGQPFTTADLEFTAKYVVDKKLTYGADMYAPVKEMEIISDTQIKYILTEPRVNFLSQVGFWVPVMPKHIYESVEDPMNFEFNGIGYGPFKLAQFKKGEYYTLERVPEWPLANDGKGAYLDRVTYRVFPDANALILAVKNGEVHATASAIPTAAQEQLLSEPDKFDVLKVPSLGFGYFSLSYKNKLLQDFNMRKAIAMTVDRDALINIAMEGGALKMETPISPVYSDLVKSNITYPAFDIEGAKELLEQSGYKAGADGFRTAADGTAVEFELICRSTTANVDSIANIFKANCEKAGIKVNILLVEPATYTERVTQKHDYDINAIDWGVIDDPDSSLGTIYLSDAALNFMEYKNEKIDEIITQSAKEPSYEKRIELMDQFQQEFVNEIPSINSWVRINSYGVSKEFGGWELKPGLYGVSSCGELVKVYKK